MDDHDDAEDHARRLEALRAMAQALPVQWPLDPLRRRSRAALLRILQLLDNEPRTSPHRS